ncbi:MAG: Late competence protein [Candidatus Magasanikbacteria bacterium GW2011_GWD2_43_18]|uniref:Late competence protein n=1 Tax=Candidatus Magasanikbacteria bacterium GW2011_GWE2_42_7 TaxID=1619052 RepID=A0A0G1BG33_9BACT|nr:MAG: Late competence protein [Candidatus Magasanikbacteria bacterium GW2011_GWC2_42_27]KKS72252.1 MAG: Late competence protein [Candidatus Magasanikbacteria bacterium GW2011_GWE2_42_7]KKT04402.1 MAG: Late competence protein [Candidatus Magasanikbacteria bacterium GW2011_GWD2_43_18]KKT25165.1 MAG: Late competence protein [Candidatus Magasanikbacteria bacterium GW2011_GWA2_43_9]HBB37631.1 hypothetical protein [Candidatus Magasanikbacteria bacterium]
MKHVVIFLAIVLCITLGLRVYLLRSSSDSEHADFSEVIEVEEKDPTLKITFLDIGQGDATLIEFPDGQQMLIDCAIDDRVLEALGRVMPFYDHDIDYLVVTHPDLDHYGGCVDVMKRFDIGHILYNGMEKPYDELWQSFHAEVQAQMADGKEYLEVAEPFVWEIASTTVNVLYPDHSIPLDEHIPGLDKDVGANDTSVVIKLSYGTQDVLLMGDVEADLEEYLVKTYGEQVDVEILKMGHHGSQSSSTQLFINATSPEVAIASCGADNKFGHPSPRVLKRFERANTDVWRTDLSGDVLVTVFEDRYDVTAQYGN